MSPCGKAEPMLPDKVNGQLFINNEVLSVSWNTLRGGCSPAMLLSKCGLQGQSTLLNNRRLQRRSRLTRITPPAGALSFAQRRFQCLHVHTMFLLSSFHSAALPLQRVLILESKEAFTEWITKGLMGLINYLIIRYKIDGNGLSL